VWQFSENYGSLVGKLDQATVDGIRCLILEGFRPKKEGAARIAVWRELRVIRDAQISLCDIFGKI